MIRAWLGIAILLLLLGLGVFSAAATEHFHETMAVHLTQAAEAAETGEWDRANIQFLQAKKIWEQARNSNAAITDHAPMEEIDRYFIQGAVYLSEQVRMDFRSCCCALTVLVEAVADAQALNWWSLL